MPFQLSHEGLGMNSLCLLLNFNMQKSVKFLFLHYDRHLTGQFLKSPREKNNWKSELPRALKAIALAVIFFVSCCYIIKNGVLLIAVISSFLLTLPNYLY